MDPNACLAEIRLLMNDHRNGEWVDLDRLVELIEALDEWLSKGNFLPAPWIYRTETQHKETNVRTTG